MNKLSRMLCCTSLVVLVPFVVNAAGTYYNGTYQSPQVTRYNTGTNSGYAAGRTTGASSYGQARYNAGYSSYSNAGSSTRTAVGQRSVNTKTRTANVAQQTKTANAAETVEQGFWLGAGLSRKSGMWQFEMKQAGSKLHYDNLEWNVLDVRAGYDFKLGNTNVSIAAGLDYGMQAGESTMVDDDITSGGYVAQEWFDDAGKLIQTQYGHALSIGTSKSGDMLGFNAEIGLKDFFKWGRVKFTPSIGWRHFTYNLETTNNYGLKIDTLDNNNSCVVDGNMEQCWPAFAFFTIKQDEAGKYPQYEFVNFEYIDLNGDGISDVAGMPVTGTYADTLDTFYFHQSDVSHSYEVTWSGPYFALDMLYDINQNNKVTGRVELGLPSYAATADQPYRIEWQHPKSIEDKSGLGGAFHLGLGANWHTAITDRVALSIGVTYDYYSVADADASTYLNPEYWTEVYNGILAEYDAAFGPENGENYMLNGFESGGVEYAPDGTALYINEIRNNGWKDTVDSEIESFFKSLGVRVGLTARF